ncbi:MAG: hypothetical protein PHX05_07670 [Acidobacteriota bacterium]|nr:hypothetical protein [Acidobacteriota bacterium]
MKRGTPEHPKMIMLMSLLNLPKYSAVGLLEMLWQFAARYCPAGDIGKYSNDAICKVVGWEADADALIEALTQSLFLDKSESHRLIIHDWSEHSDNSADRYLADHQLVYADGKTPRAQSRAAGVPRQAKSRHGKPRRAKSSHGAECQAMARNGSAPIPIPIPIPIPTPTEEECALQGRLGPDEAHRILKERPELHNLTWEQDYLVRRDFGCSPVEIDWNAVAREVSDLAILAGSIQQPGSWLRAQYGKICRRLIEAQKNGGEGWDGLKKRVYRPEVANGTD